MPFADIEDGNHLYTAWVEQQVLGILTAMRTARTILLVAVHGWREGAALYRGYGELSLSLTCAWVQKMAHRKHCSRCLDRGEIEVKCPDCCNGFIPEEGRWLHCQRCISDPGVIVIDCPESVHWR